MQSHIWQYKVITLQIPLFKAETQKAKSLQEQLNHWGAQGWELVHMPNIMSGNSFATFKKRK